MNLIEQLGGYGNASKFCDKEIKEGGYPYGLIDELLEYRRAKNIFENGDKYAYLVDWDDWIDSIYSFDLIEWGDHLWNIENMIRHATDKEIEQGFRDE